VCLCEMSNPPSTLVRPSSLNYKISLSEAVLEFIQKDMPVSDDQFIDVHTEEPKYTGSNSAAGNKAATGENHTDEFDDVMFDMTLPSAAGGRSTTKSKSTGHPMTPYSNQHHSTYISETGQTKDAWFKEEDLMRKKLEKQAIN